MEELRAVVVGRVFDATGLIGYIKLWTDVYHSGRWFHRNKHETEYVLFLVRFADSHGVPTDSFFDPIVFEEHQVEFLQKLAKGYIDLAGDHWTVKLVQGTDAKELAERVFRDSDPDEEWGPPLTRYSRRSDK